MKIKGISYDVGRVMGMNWRPLFEPEIIQKELEIIQNDLNLKFWRILQHSASKLVFNLNIMIQKRVICCSYGKSNKPFAAGFSNLLSPGSEQH